MERKPAVSLELGIQWGTASAHLAEAGQSFGSLVIGVDPINHRRLAWLKNYSNFNFIHGSSIDENVVNTITEFVRNTGPIGIVFQDSSHKYLESVREWELYSPLLDDNAVWICDDITPAFYNPVHDPPGKGMVQYFNELPGQKQVYINSLHFGNAQGIVLL